MSIIQTSSAQKKKRCRDFFKRLNADLMIIHPESMGFILLFSNSKITIEMIRVFLRLQPRQSNTQHAYSLLATEISLRFQDLLETLQSMQPPLLTGIVIFN